MTQKYPLRGKFEVFYLLHSFAAVQVIQRAYAVKCAALNPFLGRELSPLIVLTV